VSVGVIIRIAFRFGRLFRSRNVTAAMAVIMRTVRRTPSPAARGLDPDLDRRLHRSRIRFSAIT
jgi:hypothetical protein